jgi:hypothetical protein
MQHHCKVQVPERILPQRLAGWKQTQGLAKAAAYRGPDSIPSYDSYILILFSERNRI